ncbi:MAG: formate dehydrogenase subunit gamma [Actinobacteria bacterium]|nr:formate dehydrogenase subunit gamma [Actinomycetota bacterium]
MLRPATMPTTRSTRVLKETVMLREHDPERDIVRYSLADRVAHWWVSLTFIYLLLSGLALGYPRMAWLYQILGGGQTVRFLHPWVGVAFTLGIFYMLFAWVRDMTFDPVDREWARSLGTYSKEGHVDLDVGRYNAGQKGYYWFAVLTGVLLLLTGIPIWIPSLLSSGWNQAARIIHHVLFLLTVGGFIIHVYMSTAMFPGTIRGMTTGRVERRWAAFHHPRWFRDRDARGTRLG